MITPQVNQQRNAITTALMNIANPPPRRPPLPGAAGQMPQQQPMTPQNMGAPAPPPGSLPQGMPQDPAPGQPGAFPTPPTNPTPATPFTPVASAPGRQQAQQGMMPQQSQDQTGRGLYG